MRRPRSPLAPLLVLLVTAALIAPPGAAQTLVQVGDQYVLSFGGEDEEASRGVALDAAGHVYVAGNFRETVDFDPGPGEATRSLCGTCDGVFVASYDADGALRFLTTIYSESAVWANDFTVDASGNSYLAGNFYGTVDFDPGPGEAIRSSLEPLPEDGDEGYVASYGPDGSFRFVITTMGTGYDWNEAVAVDDDGNVYVMGYYEGTVDFDHGPGVEERTSIQAHDLYIASYDPAGALRYVTSLEASGLDLAVDASGRAYATGIFYGTVDFDAGPGTAERTAVGRGDGFVLGLDATGGFRYASPFGSVDDDDARVRSLGIAVDDAGTSYITGSFESTVDFDPGPGVEQGSAVGDTDLFVASYDPDGDLRFARTVGGLLNDEGRGVTLDDEGNVHLTGSFRGSADFDPGPGEMVLNATPSGVDAFLLSLDTDGDFVDVFQVHGGYLSFFGVDVAVDPDGTRHLFGDFFPSGSVNFPGGSGPIGFTTNGYMDLVLFRIDPIGAPPPPPPPPSPCDSDLRIAAFDADGQPSGEFVDLRNAGPDDAGVGNCTLAVINPYTERVTYTERLPETLLAPGATLRVTPPAATLPDGPGALGVFDSTEIAVGTHVTSLFDVRVAAVVYFDEDTIAGRFPASGKATGDLAAALRAVAENLPASASLGENSPNPFNPSTMIPYALDRPGHARLDVFDLRGRRVATLVDGVRPAGRHAVRFEAEGLASGVYLYRLHTEGTSVTRRMVLLK